MPGGDGKDTFVCLSTRDTGTTAATRDTIKDFASGGQFDLRPFDTKTGVNGDEAFPFIGTAGFNGVKGEPHAIAEAGNTILEGNMIGDDVADFVFELT